MSSKTAKIFRIRNAQKESTIFIWCPFCILIQALGGASRMCNRGTSFFVLILQSAKWSKTLTKGRLKMGKAIIIVLLIAVCWLFYEKMTAPPPREPKITEVKVQVPVEVPVRVPFEFKIPFEPEVVPVIDESEKQELSTQIRDAIKEFRLGTKTPSSKDVAALSGKIGKVLPDHKCRRAADDMLAISLSVEKGGSNESEIPEDCFDTKFVTCPNCNGYGWVDKPAQTRSWKKIGGDRYKNPISATDARSASETGNCTVCGRTGRISKKVFSKYKAFRAFLARTKIVLECLDKEQDKAEKQTGEPAAEASVSDTAGKAVTAQ